MSEGLRFGCAVRGRGGQASAQSERARSRRLMAARGGGCSSNVDPLRELYAARRQPSFSQAFAVPMWAGRGRRSVANPCDRDHGARFVSRRRLGLLIIDPARIINSEIAPFCGRQGAATRGGLLVASGGTHEEIARLLERGLVGHALGAKRVALEPLDPSPGDRRVGAGAPPRADRATTRRRGRRPRAWGEARGPRTPQSLPLRSQKRRGA
jgi:hypothetical protein